MNPIVEELAEDIICEVLQGADCRHDSDGDAEYNLNPLHEKETVQNVQELVWGAIERWVREKIVQGAFE